MNNIFRASCMLAPWRAHFSYHHHHDSDDTSSCQRNPRMQHLRSRLSAVKGRDEEILKFLREKSLSTSRNIHVEYAMLSRVNARDSRCESDENLTNIYVNCNKSPWKQFLSCIQFFSSREWDLPSSKVFVCTIQTSVSWISCSVKSLISVAIAYIWSRCEVRNPPFCIFSILIFRLIAMISHSALSGCHVAVLQVSLNKSSERR